MNRKGFPAQLMRWREEFWRAASACFALTIALLLVATTYGVYEVRAAADSRRAPQFVSARGPATTGISTQFDEIPGLGQFSIVMIDPQGPRSPLPPGVPKLDPGEVALSPALSSFDRAHPHERIADRYGRVTGTIGPEGLSAPDEVLAYAVPRTPTTSAQHVSAFGVEPGYSPWQVASSSAVFGESLQIFGLLYPLLGVVLLVLLPAVILVVAAAAVGARRRRRRDAILNALGAPPLHRTAIRLSSCVPGAVAGSLLGCVAVAAWVATSPTVPIVGSQISDEALPSYRVALTGLLGLVITMTAWAMTGRQRVATNRPVPSGTPISPWWALTAPVILWLSYTLTWAVRDNGTWFSILSWVFAIVSVPAVAVSAAAATSGVGDLIRSRGTRRGSASALIAGAWLAAQSKRTFVLALAVGGISAIAFQSALHALTLTEPAAEGRRISSVIGDGVARLQLSSGDRQTWAEALPNGQDVIAVRRDGLVGDCTALRALDLPCNGSLLDPPLSPRARALTSALMLPETATARPPSAPLTRSPGTYLVVGTDDQPVALGDVAALTQQIEGGVPDVDRVGSDWGAGEGYVLQAGWIPPITLLGLGCILAALVLAGQRAAEDLARGLASPTALFAPGRRRVLVTTAVATGFPFVIAGILAGYAGRLQAIPLLRKIGLPHALDDLTWVVVLVAVLAAGAAVATSYRLAGRTARDWRPGRDW